MRILDAVRQALSSQRIAPGRQARDAAAAEPCAPAGPTEAERALADAGLAGTPVDINHLLHRLRGNALARLPQGVPHFVSVGCAGTWYFQWIDERCAPVHHTGIEFYTPRPDDLPAHATWIANTAGNMDAVPDRTADILFSGQNIEHLWPHDIANFLLESHRVLKDDGLLVVDSPNRRVTEKLVWSHPEHTIELTPGEARELLSDAGFDVVREEGQWLCEDPATQRVLPFAEFAAGGEWPLRRRIEEAAAQLEPSFIWWFEARKSGRAPDPAKLRRRIAEIEAIAWPERLGRLQTSIGTPVDRQDGPWVDSEGRAGALLFGPYAPLPRGHHEVTWTLEYPGGRPAPHVGPVVQVSARDGSLVLAAREVPKDAAPPGEAFQVTLGFDVPDTTFGFQFVVATSPEVHVLARRHVRVASRPLDL